MLRESFLYFAIQILLRVSDLCLKELLIPKLKNYNAVYKYEVSAILAEMCTCHLTLNIMNVIITVKVTSALLKVIY
jgi:hypothetical protein